jgi:hypothetical protein
MIDLDKIFSLFGSDIPKLISTTDTSRGDDLRYVYIVKYKDERIIAIKAARNAFTTPERIIGWARLAEHYNTLGIYAPQFLRNINGEFYAVVGDCTVYAEEFAKYAPNDKINYEQSA